MYSLFGYNAQFVRVIVAVNQWRHYEAVACAPKLNPLAESLELAGLSPPGGPAKPLEGGGIGNTDSNPEI